MNIFKSNSTSLLPKLVGETRHYPPAVKEWNNSTYTYNKNMLKNLPSKDIMTSNIIKNYFNLSDSKHLARSIRMRALIRKLSGNKIFVGKPELKQTNDHISVTIYTLDMERQLLLKKIYYNIRKKGNTRNVKGVPSINLFNNYEYWRSKYGLNKSLKKLENNILILSTKNNTVNSKAKQIRRKYLYLAANNLSLKTKHLFNFNRARYFKTRPNKHLLERRHKNLFLPIKFKKFVEKRNLPYYGTKYLNETKFLRYISQFKNKSIQARKRVYYSFIKGILSTFGIKVLNFDLINRNIYKEVNKKYIKHIQDSNLGYQGKILLFFNYKEKHLNKPEILYINNIQENLPYIDKVNIVLSSIVNKILNNNNLAKSENLSLASFSNSKFENFLFKEYKGSFLKNNNFKAKLDILSIKKELSLMKDYINLKINNFKFGKYLPALKILISKIYNKKVQLNIVRLKYLYLNSDIFIDALSVKLRGKVNYNNEMKNSLKLINIPSEFNEIPNEINYMRKLNVYNSLKLKNLFTSNVKINDTDNLELVLRNIYPLPMINQQRKNTNYIQEKLKNTENSSSKLTDVIKIVKYKWVTGVRLEMAGRLTKRYTASRSIRRFINKGSLKNIDFSRKLDYLKKSMPVFMFRNIARTNTQYTFTKSKRRIGAFGIKGWIGSY